jgi:hypothetical protein
VRLNATQVRSNAELHCVFVRACARSQMRDERSQLRERPGIGGSAVDRKYCVRPHCQRLIFLETETTQKLSQTLLQKLTKIK